MKDEINEKMKQTEKIAEFKHQITEIEDLIKNCIIEQHVSTTSYEIQTLIKEWKTLYIQIFNEEISDDVFSKTEISIFLGAHSVFEDIVKAV